MRELSLFSGAGGGLLATKHLLGWTTKGYVEIDDYCQRIIKQRITDGFLDAAPIFGDIRAFNDQGYAEAYRGMVDVITAGFPCQPFSLAGKQAGENDERNMWLATIECIGMVRPRYCLLENVPGLLASGYFGTILGDLAACGYDARWRVLSAAEMGAPHKRDRLWAVAYSGENRSGLCEDENYNSNQVVDNTERERQAAALDATPNLSAWASLPAPEFWGGGDGVADWVGKGWGAVGNGQVPLVVATAWKLLMNNQIERNSTDRE